MAGRTATRLGELVVKFGVPGLGGVTVVTLAAGGNMLGRFAGRTGAIMATGAATRCHIAVIEGGGVPVAGGVAVFTGGPGRDM